MIVCSFALVSARADALDSWRWRNRLPQGNQLKAIRNANGQSIAVGGAGTILTSSNGVAWNQQISGTHADLEDVVFGNGQWVAVGSDGTILSSADGARWNLRASDTDRGLYAAAYGNGEWIATGESGFDER